MACGLVRQATSGLGSSICRMGMVQWQVRLTLTQLARAVSRRKSFA
jgi:hypothetical protein